MNLRYYKFLVTKSSVFEQMYIILAPSRYEAYSVLREAFPGCHISDGEELGCINV